MNMMSVKLFMTFDSFLLMLYILYHHRIPPLQRNLLKQKEVLTLWCISLHSCNVYFFHLFILFSLLQQCCRLTRKKNLLLLMLVFISFSSHVHHHHCCLVIVCWYGMSCTLLSILLTLSLSLCYNELDRIWWGISNQQVYIQAGCFVNSTTVIIIN